MSDLTPGRPDRAIATLLGGQTTERATVYVDLSHPESTSRLVVAFEDCTAVPHIGDLIDAVDPPSHRAATAECVGINERDRIIRVAVDWTTLREVAP